MKPPRRRRLPCALVILALSSSRAALADDGADRGAARAAFHEASSLAKQKRWSAACDRYALSLKLHHAALTLYSLGVAQREAGRLVAARASFQAFLVEPVTPTTQAYSEPARSAIVELRGRVASLALELAPGPVAGAVVTVDGVELPPGSLAERRAMDPGAHDVVARAPGRAETRAHFTLPEGATVSLTLQLPQQPPAGAAPGAPLTEPPRSAPSATDGPRAQGAPWPPALPFVLLGAGGATLAGGVALGLVGLAGAHEARSADSQAAADARIKGIAGDVLAATGLVSVGVGLVLLVVQRSRPAPATAWIGGGGAGLSVRF